MQVLATLLVACVLASVRAVIRTPLEAFRPSGEIHIRRPDKLPLLPHRRTQQKNGLKILYQTGFENLNNGYTKKLVSSGGRDCYKTERRTKEPTNKQKKFCE
ncbi:hypothetical protein KGM_203127 [Danaus plexippus plexippus]|uniref:Secreted protein n=1 Tax=Danaus plexippus plexippus TaxID=278856 RepID=A0A212FHN4_DANPL|nr:hypothetical protein KGM_203127 [Danaus plexippus plexippus]